MVLQRRRDRGFRLPHDECFAYCRGERHCEVFWLLIDLYGGREPAALELLCEGYGVRFVAATPAPEARWKRVTTGFDEREDGGWREDTSPNQGDQSDYSAWLLTWEEPWPAGLSEGEQ